MTDTLSEGEIQILASLARAKADGLSTDRVSLETASDRFGPFRAEYDNAVDKLRDKELVTGADDALSLTEAGDPLARDYHAERPDLYWYYFRKFYAAANASEAHSALCERAFGKDLCQEGMVDMEALDDLIDRLQLHRGAAVLDLGCGAGGIAEYISDRTGVKVTGLDISPSAIEVALARTESKRDRLNFVIGDLNALDLPSENYDTAINLDPNYANAYGNRGNVRQRQGDLPGAIEDFSQALEVAPAPWTNQKQVEQLLQEARNSLEAELAK